MLMVSYRYPIIAREGWKIIAVFSLLAIFVSVIVNPYIALPAWLAALFFIFIYRDPARKVPPVPLAIVGLVDGKVIDVKAVKDPYIERDAISVVVEKSGFSIISMRSPMEGKVMEQWFSAANPTSDGDTNPVTRSHKGFAQWIQNDEGDDVVLAIYPAYKFQRPRCYVHSGERVGQGQRCGVIPFRSRVEVIVPADATINVKPGDTVLAGADTIATLKSAH